MKKDKDKIKKDYIDGKYDDKEFLSKIELLYSEYDKDLYENSFTAYAQRAKRQKDPEYRERWLRRQAQKLSLDYL